MALRRHVKSMCAPIWWESARHTVVNSGSMCVVRTPVALLGITNNHVLEIYERHKLEKTDIFCQLGSAPFEPLDNLITRSKHWDLATFQIPEQTRQHWGAHGSCGPSVAATADRSGRSHRLRRTPRSPKDSPAGATSTHDVDRLRVIPSAAPRLLRRGKSRFMSILLRSPGCRMWPSH